MERGERMVRRRRPPLWRDRRFWIDNAHALLVLVIYLLLLLSRVLDATLLTQENEYLGVVLLQVLIFLIPGLIYCKLRGSTFTDRLRLHLPRPTHILFLISAFAALLSGCLLLGMYTGGLGGDSAFTLYETFSAKRAMSAAEVLYLVLAYAVLPAICEEFVFRGVLCVTLEPRGLGPMLCFGALSFGMLHFELSLLPMYIFAGALLSAVLYCTRSLVATMLLHFAYNIFGLFGQPALADFYRYTSSIELFSFLVTALFLISAVIFCGEAGRIYRRYSRRGVSADYRVSLPRGERWSRIAQTLFCPAGVACIAVYLLACLTWLG